MLLHVPETDDEQFEAFADCVRGDTVFIALQPQRRPTKSAMLICLRCFATCVPCNSNIIGLVSQSLPLRMRQKLKNATLKELTVFFQIEVEKGETPFTVRCEPT